MDSDGFNLVVVLKGRERYIFLFNNDRRADLAEVVNRFANESQLSFSEQDAEAVLERADRLQRA